jgi:hypothetical protein
MQLTLGGQSGVIEWTRTVWVRQGLEVYGWGRFIGEVGVRSLWTSQPSLRLKRGVYRHFTGFLYIKFNPYLGFSSIPQRAQCTSMYWNDFSAKYDKPYRSEVASHTTLLCVAPRRFWSWKWHVIFNKVLCNFSLSFCHLVAVLLNLEWDNKSSSKDVIIMLF